MLPIIKSFAGFVQRQRNIEPLQPKTEITPVERERMLFDLTDSFNPYYERLISMGSAIRAGTKYTTQLSDKNDREITTNKASILDQLDIIFENQEYKTNFTAAFAQLLELNQDKNGDALMDYIIEEQNTVMGDLLQINGNTEQLRIFLVRNLIFKWIEFSKQQLTFVRLSDSMNSTAATLITSYAFLGMHFAKLTEYAHILASEGGENYQMEIDSGFTINLARLEARRREILALRSESEPATVE